jgi:hypothetical protein
MLPGGSDFEADEGWCGRGKREEQDRAISEQGGQPSGTAYDSRTKAFSHFLCSLLVIGG